MNEKNGNYGKNENCENYGTSRISPPQKPHRPHVSHGSHNSHNSHSSHNSHTSHPQERLLKPRGDCRTLLSYQKTAVIYQITYRFCHRFLDRGDRTIGQMVQAARSGKQNIVEGSRFAMTSKDAEIRLTNTARSSLEELLEDYYDFLTTRALRIWDKESREAQYVRKLGTTNPLPYELFQEFVETRPAEVVANIAICLIHQANYLLDRQLESLGLSFLKDGGLRERMTRARLQARDEQRESQLDSQYILQMQ